jgi:hypothetical protein
MSEESETIAAQAYQVLGALAADAGLYEHPEVLRAMDYFSGIANGKPPADDFLPWAIQHEPTNLFEVVRKHFEGKP